MNLAIFPKRLKQNITKQKIPKASLRYNSYIVQFTHFKYAMQLFWYIHWTVQPSPLPPSKFRICFPPQKNPVVTNNTSYPPQPLSTPQKPCSALGNH